MAREHGNENPGQGKAHGIGRDGGKGQDEDQPVAGTYGGSGSRTETPEAGTRVSEDVASREAYGGGSPGKCPVCGGETEHVPTCKGCGNPVARCKCR